MTTRKLSLLASALLLPLAAVSPAQTSSSNASSTAASTAMSFSTATLMQQLQKLFAALQAAQAKVTTPSAPVTTPSAPVTTPSTPVTTPSTPVTTTPSPLASSVITAGVNGSLNGFQPRIIDDLYTDISNSPVDAFTTTFMATYGPNTLHSDFTIPYTVVNHATTVTPVSVYTADESDVMPIPLNASDAIENGAQGCTDDGMDHHALMVDNATGWDYEVYQAAYCNGQWSAYSVTAWDMLGNEQRPVGWTSGDAAGLPIFPLLVRYDEVANGSINHALRVTINHTKTGPTGGIFVPPATHAAGDIWGVAAYTGMRMRLKANYDISGFSASNQVILKALKKYGMIVADNGQSGFFQGTADSRWNTDDLVQLRKVALNNFDIIQMGTQLTADTAPAGPAPTIASFTASNSNGSSTLTWSVTNSSYNYIQEFGPVRGNSQVVPYASGKTYTLVSSNQYGRSTKVVTLK